LPSLRLIANTFAYCRDEVPRWNTISISGYHMAEAGATPAQEVAFTLADGIAYVEAALQAGLRVDEFAPRLSFFFVARTTLLEEVAKFRSGAPGLGSGHAGPIRRDEPKVADAALSHPDGRRPAHCAAARGQLGAGVGAGPRRRTGWHSVAAYELVRRGDRPPDREGGPAGVAHSAGTGQRDRRHGIR
jgi:hypothetical protein